MEETGVVLRTDGSVDHQNTYNARMAQIIRLIVDGFVRRDIMEYVVENNWDVSERQVDRYISKAREEIQSVVGREAKLAAGKSIHRLEDLYQKCIAIMDYKTALQVVKEQNDLFRLKQVGAENAGDAPLDLSGMSFEELYKLMHGVEPGGDFEEAEEVE